MNAEPIDVRPLFEKMERAEARVYSAARILLDTLDSGGDISDVVVTLRGRCADVAVAEVAWDQAISHNIELARKRAEAEPPLFANPDGLRLVPGDPA